MTSHEDGLTGRQPHAKRPHRKKTSQKDKLQKQKGKTGTTRKTKKVQNIGKPQIEQIVNTLSNEIITTTIKSAFSLIAQNNTNSTYIRKGKDKCNIKRLTNTRTKKKYAKYTEQFNTFNALNLHSTKMHPKVQIMCKEENFW